jgi:hypothetical protein
MPLLEIAELGRNAMNEQETMEEFAARMGAYYQARKEYPWEELCAKYRGKYFAWGPDGKTIVASAESCEALEEQLVAAGYDLARCVIDVVDYELL